MNDSPPVSIPPQAYHDGLRKLDLAVDADTESQLGQYLAILLAANREFNLTSVRDPAQAWIRHVLDSLTLCQVLEEGARIMDIGSGGGLPGIPLAIARPDLEVSLVEATGKKARFLLHVAETLALSNVTVVADRAENVGRDPEHRERYDVVTGRAVGPLRVFVELAAPLAQIGGRILAVKGRDFERELAEAASAMKALSADIAHTRKVFAGTENETVLVELVKRAPTAERYPRRPGQPKKKPL